MSVRLKIALTIFATGLVTALAVIATVLLAFQRFEHETTYQRATRFLGRVASMYDNMVDMHQRQPDDFNGFLRNLVLFEPDTQLYLLDPAGTVLSSTGSAQLPPGFAVALGPVKQSINQRAAPYVMGDDPERMDANAVIAAVPLSRSTIRANDPVAGYLYLVAHRDAEPATRWQALRASAGRPALGLILAIVGFTTLLAALVVASVTRPLRRLTDAVAALSRKGLQEGAADAGPLLPPATRDEFGQLTMAFGAMLSTLQTQWDTMRRLDHFRREAVSNLSHDLRSPLTATAGCLETLEARWAGDPARAEDSRLAGVALRNTRNAAGLVKALGDLATLDEPSFQLRLEQVDLRELLDDIAMRFHERAVRHGIVLAASPGDHPVVAHIDIELFERAVANLVDNALKFCGTGCHVTLAAETRGDGVHVWVADTGPGIPADELAHLFDRFYQARTSVEPASADTGRGLGLAIVKRIAELHGGRVAVTSEPGHGTRVAIELPTG
ncbi:HAMP domain-containing sensor histidine kinase [Rhizobacter sp. Root1221]|uniref:sensor histidine kinase n=1 Tax=Rhizobacter sp. Root1221 TaxID=1736433 RepID=UPI0006F665FD|nr:HAMP domain-containing sensor histidine kinase [Rhizobacter sp. Root1221]KQV99515.1 hypothetical protein ASC87_02090 [Rhizobacter sp. Root1221]